MPVKAGNSFTFARQSQMGVQTPQEKNQMPTLSPLPISDRISHPLRQVAQRQWTVLAARGVLQTLVVGLAFLLASSLLLGFLPGIWMPLRVALAIIVWGSVVWTAVRCLRPALQRLSLSRAAQVAEGTMPDSQERMSSAVELSQSRDEFRGSAALVAHLVGQAEQDAQRVNAVAVVPFSSIFQRALLIVPVLVLWMVFTFNARTAYPLLRGLYSTLMPWRSALPPLLSDISVKPGDVVLAQGDNLDVVAKVSAAVGGKESGVGQVSLVRKFGTGPSVSQSLEQTAARQFHANLENLQQTFQYRVTTENAHTPWYTATVRPVPAIARLDVHYDYPKYSGLRAADFLAADGNIDALTGTQITLTLHTTDALSTDRSKLLFDADKPGHHELALAQIGTNTYQAKFDINQSGEYRIKLLNEYNLSNKDDQSRAITAEADEPPSVTITSPGIQVTVRPNDDVPVMYVAGDDFGIARLEALVQVDDRPERTLPIVIHARNHRDIHDQWLLSVPAILAQDGVKEARRISYQIKAADNRDPDPQTGLSARQTLLINKNEGKSYADKLNEKRKNDLQTAIQKAINRLNEINGVVEPMAWRNGQQPLDAEGLRLVFEQREKLNTTSKDLSATAEDYLQTPFAEVAQAAQDVADKVIPQAADDTARITLDAGTYSARKRDAETAHREIIVARDALQKLLDKALLAALNKAESADALKDAAAKQKEVAQEMRQNPQETDQNRRDQQEAINKLNEAIQKDPAQQNPQAQQLAKKLAELADKIEQNEKQQTDLQNNTSKQQELAQAQDQANALAEQQKKLNEEVQKFSKNDKDPLQQAGAQTPTADQEKDLVNNIEKNQIQQAALQPQQQADQLKQDAQKLAADAKSANVPLNADQQKQQQKDQQNQQDAQTAQNDANKAAEALKGQADPAQPQQSADAAAQQTQKAAEQIAKQADAIAQQNQQGAKNADVQKDAEKAKADAKTAQHDASAAQHDANAADAKKDMQKAAGELAQAGADLNQAAQAQAKADMAADQQQNQAAAGQAAEQAQGLADAQQEIAKALGEQAQQAADAQQQGATPDQQSADQQQQLANQTQEARKAARQLAQQAQKEKDANLAGRADKAAEALNQAAVAQKQAAKAQAKHDNDQAAQAQADAQQALAKADQALRGNPDQAQADADQGQGDQGQPDQAQANADQGQGQPEQSGAQAAQEAAAAQQQAMAPNPAAAQQAAQALAKASAAALGISPADWAKLPPLMQKQLQNASQQSGPPAYREMIKDYYIRLSHMEVQRPG